MAVRTYTSVHRDGDAVTITGKGSLDLTNFGEFHQAIKAAAVEADSVTVDLREAEFVDTAVVQDLGVSAVTMMKRGKSLRVLVDQTRYPYKVLQISGFGEIMDIEAEPGEDK